MLFHYLKRILLLLVIGYAFALPQATQALSVNPFSFSNTKSDLQDELNQKPLLEIRIPGLNFGDISSSSDETGAYVYISWIPELLTALYKFGIAIASIVAVVMIIIQGVQIVTSGGNTEAISTAYNKISHAVIGLFIAWGSFVILYTINPKLTEFNPLKIKVVERQELDVSASNEPATDASNLQNTGAVPYFAQYDSRWAELKPGDPQWPFDISKCKDGKTATIRNRGCGPTSVAMILQYYGKNTTPLETAKFSLGCSGAMSANNLSKLWTTSPWADLKFQFVQQDKAIALAIQNTPLVVNCHPCTGYTGDGQLKTYSGHYMVITGSSDNGATFNINDPGGNPSINHAIIKMTRSQLLTPNKDEALEGCAGDGVCLSKISTMRAPSFIYIHP